MYEELEASLSYIQPCLKARGQPELHTTLSQRIPSKASKDTVSLETEEWIVHLLVIVQAQGGYPSHLLKAEKPSASPVTRLVKCGYCL